LPFDTLGELRMALYADVPHMAVLDELPSHGSPDLLKALNPSKTGKTLAKPLSSSVSDYFLTNPIARASKVMAECSAMRSGAMQQAAE
jgi:NADH-quinone oxidoreductase subunit G